MVSNLSASDTATDYAVATVVRLRPGVFDDAWFRDWFEPTLHRIDIRCLSWEEIIDVIAFHAPEMGQLIDTFYGKCLRFNRPQARARYPGRRSGAGLPEWAQRN